MKIRANKYARFGISGKRSLLLRAALIGAIVFAVGLGLDWTLLPGRRQLLYSDIVTGLVSVGLSFLAMNYYYAQQRAAENRLRAIAEVNHHVRNALFAITLSVHVRNDHELIKITQEAANRIDWVLREVMSQKIAEFDPGPERDWNPT